MNISDIATLAGVSKAAVSRYFNNGYLSPDKKEAIRKAVEDTGYTPNLQAQTLRTRKSKQIGVVIPKLSSSSTPRVVDGISKVLARHGYQLILANTENTPEKEVEYLDLLRRHHVEGVIFLASVFTADHKNILKSMHIPVVIIGQLYNGYDCVYHDDSGAVEALTDLIISKGRHKIGYIGVTPKDKAAGYERHNGYIKALKNAGISPNEKLATLSEFSADSGYENAKKIFSGKIKPDAIICATDSIAVGALQFCKDNNYSVPKDVMIAGVGDSTIGRYCYCPLTSAHLHYKTSGETAAEILLAKLTKHSVGCRTIRLDYEITERSSTSNL